jgi:hypothetical protein
MADPIKTAKSIFDQFLSKADPGSMPGYNPNTKDAQAQAAGKKKYAHRNFCLISTWLGVVGTILFLQGLRVAIYGHGFDLSRSVLLTLIGSTTGSVLAIFIIVTESSRTDNQRL